MVDATKTHNVCKAAPVRCVSPRHALRAGEATFSFTGGLQIAGNYFVEEGTGYLRGRKLKTGAGNLDTALDSLIINARLERVGSLPPNLGELLREPPGGGEPVAVP